MRHIRMFQAQVLLFLAMAAVAQGEESFNWDLWRHLPVQHGGRQKPLDTLARESWRAIVSRDTLRVPESHERLDPVAAYLTLLLEWRGWEHPDKDQLGLLVDWRPLYSHLQTEDQWDAAPLVHIDSLSLRVALNLEKDRNYVAPQTLAKATIEDRRTDRTLPFGTWADKLLELEAAGEELTALEKDGVQLANRLWAYQNLRMGRGLELLPVPGSEEQKWMPVAQLYLIKFDETTDPSGALRNIQDLFIQVRQSFQNRDAATFNLASAQLLAALRLHGPQLGIYPKPRTIRLEVAHNRWKPFRIGWVLMLVAAAGLWLDSGLSLRPLHHVALGAYGCGLTALAIGFALRIAISGRPPVTNMYESVIYVGAGVATLGLVLGIIYRQPVVLSAAAAASTLALLMADNCPLVLDPSVRPLEPVLRSSFWLVTHVMTITLSYAAFALALGLGNVTLGYYLLGRAQQPRIASLSQLTYKALQVGVLLLAAGIILGGVWADYSWGRFWGWDPKEVWALIALLGYLAVLHARFAGWVGHRALAALAVACFALVVMAWYGVNFVLGAGLHSYGFGGGGQGYVFAAVALQLLYVACAMSRSLLGEADTSRPLPQAEFGLATGSEPTTATRWSSAL